MTRFSLRMGAETAEFDVTRQGNQIRVSYNDETAVFHLLHAEGAQLLLEQELPDGRRRQLRIAGHVDGDQRQLWVNGRTLRCERVRETAVADAGDASLAATIPAVVVDILVQTGETVSAGDKLILLESMKMVIPIQAPHDGVVADIHCAVGDSVQAGVPLLALDPTSPAAA